MGFAELIMECGIFSLIFGMESARFICIWRERSTKRIWSLNFLGDWL